VPAFETAIGADGAPVGELPSGIVTQTMAQRLRELAGGRLGCAHGRVTYWFPGIERDGDRLMRAAKLVAEFQAGPGGGVFR